MAIIDLTHQPPEWENQPSEETEPMTLCIAAECSFSEGEPAIVMCCDWRAQTGSLEGLLIGTEDAKKIRELTENMSALIAGHPSDATEVLAGCRDAVRNFSSAKPPVLDVDITVSAFQSELRSAAGSRKIQIINDYTRSHYGMDYKDFVREIASYTTGFQINFFDEIKRLDLGADLLLCGFCINTPVIVALDRFGYARWRNNYAAIGNGGDIARALLCLESWDAPKISVEQCIYRIYEAKKAAYLANPDSVGEATSIQILIKAGDVYRMGCTPKYLAYIDETFDRKHRVPELSYEGEVYDLDTTKLTRRQAAT